MKIKIIYFCNFIFIKTLKHYNCSKTLQTKSILFKCCQNKQNTISWYNEKTLYKYVPTQIYYSWKYLLSRTLSKNVLYVTHFRCDMYMISYKLKLQDNIIIWFHKWKQTHLSIATMTTTANFCRFMSEPFLKVHSYYITQKMLVLNIVTLQTDIYTMLNNLVLYKIWLNKHRIKNYKNIFRILTKIVPYITWIKVCYIFINGTSTELFGFFLQLVVST
jgi:hypothetical protein